MNRLGRWIIGETGAFPTWRQLKMKLRVDIIGMEAADLDLEWTQYPAATGSMQEDALNAARRVALNIVRDGVWISQKLIAPSQVVYVEIVSAETSEWTTGPAPTSAREATA